MNQTTDSGPTEARPDSVLTVRTNRRNALPYLVSVTSTLATSGRKIRMRYIPDKLLVERSSFAAFVSGLATTSDTPPEDLALAILDEINNEIVPRWIEITVGAEADSDPEETVTLEDRQPNWDAPDLLSRLSVT